MTRTFTARVALALLAALGAGLVINSVTAGLAACATGEVACP